MQRGLIAKAQADRDVQRLIGISGTQLDRVIQTGGDVLARQTLDRGRRRASVERARNRYDHAGRENKDSWVDQSVPPLVVSWRRFRLWYRPQPVVTPTRPPAHSPCSNRVERATR